MELVSRDGKINYAEDSYSTIKECLENYTGMGSNEDNDEYCNRILAYRDHYTEGLNELILVQDEFQSDSMRIVFMWLITPGSSKVLETISIPSAYIRLNDCDFKSTLDEFCEVYGITEEMLEWADVPPIIGTEAGEMKAVQGSIWVSSGWNESGNYYEIYLRSDSEGSTIYSKWENREISFSFAKASNGELVLIGFGITRQDD